jgi:siroheme synthase (precorrin-2 oxidase/ferrochelatase)
MNTDGGGDKDEMENMSGIKRRRETVKSWRKRLKERGWVRNICTQVKLKFFLYRKPPDLLTSFPLFL